MKQHEKLKDVMYRWGSDIKEVAEILHLKEKSVKQWRTEAGANITDNNLALLEFRLGEKRTQRK